MTDPQTAMKKELAAALVAKAEGDPAFRKALLTDAKSAVERVLGTALGTGLQIKAVEETESLMYLVLPPAAEGELSDAALSGVSGGSGNLFNFGAVRSFIKKLTESPTSAGPESSTGINTSNTVNTGGIKSSDINPNSVSFPKH